MGSPLSIRAFFPPEVPGLRVVRYRTDGRLWRAVKERYSVMMTYAGRAEWTCDGEVRYSTPGTLDIKQRGDVYRDLRRDGPACFQVFAFDEALVAEARERMRLPASSRLLHAQLARELPAAAPFVRLHALFTDEGPRPSSSALMLQTAAIEALSALVGCFGASPSAPMRHSSRSVRRAFEVLHASLEEGISLDALAGHAGLDKFHLCRAFREEVGMPPYAYLTHLRVSRAMGLLTQGRSPSSVAPQVGFYDQSQLNRHFKRIVGLTPGQFARSVQ
ncbi:helix-turn-helix transcriptional regulator [Myxococcus sp. AM011]|uniref:helix-turn-helix domain-containing protein n=1 Tax=Myxococcus sp. AM011 TaxID=2745200 RepID=UPI001594F89C|nr:helix-turn-helix transcriptional regulator [Myxococcus sp. AM011]